MKNNKNEEVWLVCYCYFILSLGSYSGESILRGTPRKLNGTGKLRARGLPRERQSWKPLSGLSPLHPTMSRNSPTHDFADQHPKEPLGNRHGPRVSDMLGDALEMRQNTMRQ